MCGDISALSTHNGTGCNLSYLLGNVLESRFYFQLLLSQASPWFNLAIFTAGFLHSPYELNINIGLQQLILTVVVDSDC
jgi:hypothetical protein